MVQIEAISKRIREEYQVKTGDYNFRVAVYDFDSGDFLGYRVDMLWTLSKNSDDARLHNEEMVRDGDSSIFENFPKRTFSRVFPKGLPLPHKNATSLRIVVEQRTPQGFFLPTGIENVACVKNGNWTIKNMEKLN